MTEKSKPIVRPKNAFEFASIASARAKQLQQGCVPKVEGSAKLARRAAQEVEQGAVQRADSTDAQ